MTIFQNHARAVPMAELLADDAKTMAPPVVRAAVGLIGVAVIGFVTWAAVATVNETAVTFGEIVPMGTLQAIQNLEGGIVSEVLVKEGDLVQPGQPLVRFDPVSASADRDQIESRQAALQIEAARLDAFINGKPADFSKFARWPGLVADQSKILASQIQTRDNQQKVIDFQIAERRSDATASKRQLASLAQGMDMLNKKVQMRQELASKGTGSQLSVWESQRERSGMEVEMHRLEGIVNGSTEQISELTARRAEIETRLKNDALNRQGQVSAELAELANRMTGLGARVDRLVAVAPKAGIVQELPVKTIGGVVSPGGVVARIVPIDEAPLIEIRIDTQDIGFVAVDQPVRVKVQAFDFARYGTIEGKLLSISPTTFFDEKKTPYYRGRALLQQSYINTPTGPRQLVPGMTVEADIETGRKTVLQYLLRPIYANTSNALSER